MSKISVNRAPSITALLDQHQWTDLPTNWPTAAVTNGGATGNTVRRLVTDSSSTATSTALIRTGADPCWSIGQTNSVIDWTKKIALQFIVRAVGTTNGFARISMGKTSADGIGNLARKGIGFRIDDDAIKGQAHDGSSLATVDLSATISGGLALRLTVTSDGQGNIEWFVNGVSKGSSAGGPSELGTAGESVLQLEVDNGGDAAQQYLQIADSKIYIEQ